MKLMVFDVGGTEIKYSVMDENLNIYDKGYTATPMDTLAHFIEVCKELYLPHKNEVEGIAMSLPGFIDRDKGRVNGGGALIYNIGQDVGVKLAEACGCTVHLENDGKAAAVAELWKGSLQGCKNAAVFIIGTGVGGGIIVDGKIIRGRDGTAGEFSFLNADSAGWYDRSVTVSSRCSTTGLIALYNNLRGQPDDTTMNGRVLFANYFEGDEYAKQALTEFARQVSVQVFNLSALLNVEKVAIGGGISKQPVLVEMIRNEFAYMMEHSVWNVNYHFNLPVGEVVACQFGNEANQIGAMYSYAEAEGRLAELGVQ